MYASGRRHGRALVAVALALGLAACSDTTKPAPAEPPAIPANDTPENTILRFMGLYSTMDFAEYGNLFTGDFSFEFSSAADADLVSKFGTDWSKSHELQAAENLFQGGADMYGTWREGALFITVTLTPTTPGADSSLGRDPVTHKTLLASVDVLVDLAGGTDYVIGEAPPQSNRFFLVRGDAAVGLSPEQPADANHWYIWHWRDESPYISKKSLQNENSTWGRLKGLYY